MAIASGGSTPSTKVVIAATRGHYGGQPANVTYHLDLIGLSRPTSVTLDGVPLREGPAQASWSYDGSTDTVAVTLGTRSIRSVLTVVEHGGQVVDRAEPSVAAVP